MVKSRSWGRAKIAEVSSALGIRRDVYGSSGVGILFPPPFLGKEEKGLFLVGVVVIWNVNGAANGIAEIMFLVGSLLGSWIGPFFPGLGIKEFVA